MRTRVSQFRTAVTATALAVLVACTPTPSVTGTPTTSSTSPPVPGFPDLSQFTPVDTQTYVMSYPYFNGFVFTTPDGQRCGHNSMSSLSDPVRLVLGCTVKRPDMGPGEWALDVASDEDATIQPKAPRRDPNPDYVPDPSRIPKLLPPMHRLTFKDIECAVDDKGTLACLVGKHGFLLTATSTELF